MIEDQMKAFRDDINTRTAAIEERILNLEQRYACVDTDENLEGRLTALENNIQQKRLPWRRNNDV